MYKYPKTMETILNSENIVFEKEDLHLGEMDIEAIYDNKLYKIEWVCGRIRSCYVYDLDGNLVDEY